MDPRGQSPRKKNTITSKDHACQHSIEEGSNDIACYHLKSLRKKTASGVARALEGSPQLESG